MVGKAGGRKVVGVCVGKGRHVGTMAQNQPGRELLRAGTGRQVAGTALLRSQALRCVVWGRVGKESHQVGWGGLQTGRGGGGRHYVEVHVGEMNTRAGRREKARWGWGGTGCGVEGKAQGAGMGQARHGQVTRW